MNERVGRLRNAMQKDELDAVLLTSTHAIRYLSGFAGDDATLIVTGNRVTLLVDSRYTVQAQAESQSRIAEITHSNYLDTMKALLGDEQCQSVGFEDESMSVAARVGFNSLGLNFIPYSAACDRLRLIKSSDEVDKMQRAQQIADRAFAELLDKIRPGMSEKRVAAELIYLCGKLSSGGAAFPPIVASGPNGAMCHATPSDRQLQQGDLVVLDFGCTVDGYCSDMTRTIAIGKPGDEARRVYDIVLEAQRRALDALRPGISGRELDGVAREYITAQGCGEHFGHGLGHGFGLLIHEAPTANKNAQEPLEAGMTVTVEPGIYLPGRFGVRIEDCCVLTETGHTNLASTPKELIILG